jgi:hypothetical protein
MMVGMPVMMTGMIVTVGRFHMGQHFGAAGAHETPDEHGG